MAILLDGTVAEGKAVGYDCPSGVQRDFTLCHDIDLDTQALAFAPALGSTAIGTPEEADLSGIAA
jgi:hypothetical protein